MSEATVSGPSGHRRDGRRPTRELVVAVIALAVVAAGCSSDAGTETGGSSTSTSTSTIAGGASAESSSVQPSTAGSTVEGGGAAVTTTPAPATGASDVTSTTAAPTTTTIPPTTTTTIPLVTEGALVLVANAAGIPGAAGQLTGVLQGVGFSMKEPTDAAGYEESLDASKIYFRPEAEAAAMSLGAVMQITSVSRMPTPAPIVDAQVGLGDATILIMLGRDLAAKEVPGLAGR